MNPHLLAYLQKWIDKPWFRVLLVTVVVAFAISNDYSTKYKYKKLWEHIKVTYIYEYKKLE